MMPRTRLRHLGVLAAATVALACLAATSWAWQASRHRGDAPCRLACESGRLDAALANQGLSDEQIVKIKDLRSRFRADTRELKARIRQRGLTLAAELAKAQPDRSAALAVYQELAGLRSEMGAKRIAHLLDLKEMAPEVDLASLGTFGRRHHGRRWFR